ncbi:MAG: thioredoxin family protein [Candidatus Eisenbacteria bacterium]
MKVQVLGTGCFKCNKLAERVEAVVKELNSGAKVIKVTDIEEIVKSGVMMTPALVIDGQVKSSGRIPSDEEIKSWVGEPQE